MYTLHRIPICRLLVIGLIWTMIAIPGTSWAAFDAYATIEGATQGVIEGDVTLVGREGTIRVVSYGYNVSADYDPATGSPSGQRQHRPVRILKNIDNASPLLFKAMTDNETLVDVTIRFYRPNNTGAEEQFYTVRLENAHIVGIMPHHEAPDGNEVSVPEREMISLTFERIVFTYEDGSITAGDDW